MKAEIDNWKNKKQKTKLFKLERYNPLELELITEIYCFSVLVKGDHVAEF